MPTEAVTTQFACDQQSWASGMVAPGPSRFEDAGLPEDDLMVVKAPVPPRAPEAVRPADRVSITGGLHAGREGSVAFVLPISGLYARIEFPEGLRTVPIRYLWKLSPTPPACSGD